MACPKFDRKNKKHVLIAASVAAAIVLLIVIIVVVVVLMSGSNATIEALCKADENNVDVKGADWKEIGLNLHNKYRKVHHANPMTLSDDLNQKAEQCAKHYANKRTIDHSCGYKEGAGENLYMSGGSNGPSEQEAKNGIKAWYCEAKDYNFKKAGFSGGTGHFTQVVWKESTELGLGLERNGNQVFFVALYKPHGNMQGNFPANVEAP